MLRNLHDSIVDYELNTLRAIARARGFELQANRQAPAVDELKDYLLNQEATDWAWSRLPEDAREALLALLRAGGQMKAHIYTDRFGKPRSFGPGRLEREKPWLDPQNPAEYLWFMGLIFSTFHDVGRGYRAEFMYVPFDVVPFLPEVEVVQPHFEVTPVDEPPVTRSHGTALVDALFTVLARLQMDPLPANRKGHLTQAALEKLPRYHPAWEEGRDTPLSPDAREYLDFILHLARTAELTHIAGDRLRPNPEVAREWLKWGRARQLYHLQRTWWADPGWDELRHIPELIVEETGWQNDPVLARQAVLDHLGDCSTEGCPLNTWLSVESLVSAIKAVDPDFARPDGDYRSWYIRDRASGEYLMDFACWDHVEARLIRYLLAGPLYRLGVVDLGDEGAALTAFRVTPHGEALLGKAEPPAAGEAPPAALEVGSDFTVRFSPDVRLYERFQTHRFARPVSGTEEGSVYQITQNSLSAAHAQGITAQMILIFLQQHSPEPLPANVVNALRNRRPD